MWIFLRIIYDCNDFYQWKKVSFRHFYSTAVVLLSWKLESSVCPFNVFLLKFSCEKNDIRYRFEQWIERWNFFLRLRWNKKALFWKMALIKEDTIFKLMIDNNDEPFPIIINKLNSFSFNLYGCEVTMYIWPSGILLIKKYWFLHKKLIIFAIGMLFPSSVIRMS